MTDEEGVDGHRLSGMTSLDMAFTELGAEPLQQPDLLVRQLDPVEGKTGSFHLRIKFVIIVSLSAS